MKYDNRAIRWALVTFAASITSGTLGHFLSGTAAAGAVFLISAGFAVIGAFAISLEDSRP